MKKILLFAMVMLASLFAFSQDDPKIVGYYLRSDGNAIKVYQSIPGDQGKPNLSMFNFWDLHHHYNYWFKTDITVPGSDNKKYIRITIPNSVRYTKVINPVTKKDTVIYETSPNYGSPLGWKEEQRGEDVDSQDFNSWLWVSEEDFNRNKVPFYGRNVTFQVSAITTPFKYRFSSGTHSSSIQNSDFNLGTFLGGRLGNTTNTTGLNLGVIFGVNSTTMNSANNGSITDKSSQSNLGLNYGAAAVVDIVKKFQFGIIAGWDHATGDLGQGYIYQDRMWLGLSLNYKFLSFGGDAKKQ